VPLGLKTTEDVKVNLSDTRAKFAAKFIASANLRHVKLSDEAAIADTNTAESQTHILGKNKEYKTTKL